MSRRAILIAVAAVVTLAMVVVWLLAPHQEAKPGTMQPGTDDAPKSIARTASSPPAPISDEERRLKQEERAKIINTAIEGGNVPISFWGKVIDQDGKPIAGATISYNYSTEHGNLLGVAWSASKVHKASTTSNGAGLFSIQGLKGSGLSIESLQKEGYQYNPRRANTYDYYGSSAAGKFTPDATSPVLFLMLNKTTAEPLVSYGGNFGKTIRVPGDGTPARLNLWKGQPDPSGELQITFKREPAVLARVGPPTSWSAKIEVIGGGIVEADPGELLHQAPGAGYAPTVDYPKAEQKRGVSARSFYVKTADGKYGYLQLELYPGDDGPAARCLIKASMNPSGLRNLESLNSEQVR